MMGEEQSLSRASIFTGSILSCCLSKDSILPATTTTTVASRLEDVTSSPAGLSTGSSAGERAISLVGGPPAMDQSERSAVIDVSTRDRGLTGPTDRWSGGQLMDWLPGHQHHPTLSLPLLIHSPTTTPLPISTSHNHSSAFFHPRRRFD